MVTVDTIARVRRAYFVQKRKIKAIARDLKLERNTVRQIVRAEDQTEHRYVRMRPRLGLLRQSVVPDHEVAGPPGDRLCAQCMQVLLAGIGARRQACEPVGDAAVEARQVKAPCSGAVSMR